MFNLNSAVVRLYNIPLIVWSHATLQPVHCKFCHKFKYVRVRTLLNIVQRYCLLNFIAGKKKVLSLKVAFLQNRYCHGKKKKNSVVKMFHFCIKVLYLFIPLHVHRKYTENFILLKNPVFVQ